MALKIKSNKYSIAGTSRLHENIDDPDADSDSVEEGTLGSRLLIDLMEQLVERFVEPRHSI